MDIKSTPPGLQSLIGGTDLARLQDQARQRDAANEQQARQGRAAENEEQRRQREARVRVSSAEELAQARINAKRAFQTVQSSRGQETEQQRFALSGANDEARFRREAPFGNQDAQKPRFVKLGQIIDIYV